MEEHSSAQLTGARGDQGRGDARALLEKAREGLCDNTGGREPPTPSV